MDIAYLVQRPAPSVTTIVPAFLAALVLLVQFSPSVRKRTGRWRLPLALSAYMLTRFGVYYVMYVLLGYDGRGADVESFHKMGMGALGGKLVYTDFLCVYSPLFPYLLAPAYAVSHFVGSAVVTFIALDAVCLALLCKFVRMILGRERVIDFVLLWALNPAVWIVTVRYSQDESGIAAFILLAAYLYTVDSKWWNPFVLAVGILLTKATTALPMLVIYTYSRTKVRDALVAATVVATVFLIFGLLGADLMQPFAMQDKTIHGVSITTIVARLFIPVDYQPIAQRISIPVTLLALAIVIFAARCRKLPVLWGMTVSIMVFLLFAPMSASFYRLWVMGPLAIHAFRSNRIPHYVFYSTLLCVFDGFLFYPLTPRHVIYAMAVIAATIIYLEIRYVFEILNWNRSAELDNCQDSAVTSDAMPAVVTVSS